MKDFVFSVFTSKHKSCLIYSSKRDTHKQISRCSLKTCDEKKAPFGALLIRLHRMVFCEWYPLLD